MTPSHIGSALRCVAITGGTGSFGMAFTQYLLTHTDAKIRIVSRDEDKQDNMRREIPDSRLTFIIGDVRDSGKLRTAFDGADAVVHAAALKRVPTGETQADELIKTNIVGSANVIDAAISARVPHSLFISTDKAVQPINEYGKSKAVAEGLFTQANLRGTSRQARFATVRGGNVWGSRGSVIEAWRTQQPIVIHDPQATRFHLPMPEWCEFCWRALCEMRGGEVYVPVLRAWSILALARAFLMEHDRSLDDYLIDGDRQGDKRHECLIAPHEERRTVQVDSHTYIIEPPSEIREVWNYIAWDGDGLDQDLQYTSAMVPHLSTEELREWMRHVHHR